jgi:hypothetical protein
MRKEKEDKDISAQNAALEGKEGNRSERVPPGTE